MKYYKYNTIQGNLIVVPRTPFLVPQGALQAMGNSRYLKNLSLVFHNLSSHSHFQNILSQDGDEKEKLDIVGVGLIEIFSAVHYRFKHNGSLTKSATQSETAIKSI